MESVLEKSAKHRRRASARHDLDFRERIRSSRAAARARRSAAARSEYAACNAIAGPLDFSPDPFVQFRRVASFGESCTLSLLVVLNAVVDTSFVVWLLLPGHDPGHGTLGFEDWKLTVARGCFVLVIGIEIIRLVQNFALWVFAIAAKDPVPKALPSGLSIALLTTIVPSKEPLEIVERTLRAMKMVRYRGQVDVWILDEGDDPRVKTIARRLGVHHFTRKGIPQFNQSKGQFRAKTKAGNHNAWRSSYERFYDVVAQMDPDHVPLPSFLERTVGYFRDPDVAFVVAPQVYGNLYESWVVHGASAQQYLFSGVVERGGNGLGAPILIGTNHLYRPSAWHEIGGYQDSIIEDQLTSMRIHGTLNPATGNYWKGVYTPDILAIGEGPTSWTDYFNQQKRWAYGVWEILLNRKLRSGIRLRLGQRLLYGLIQFWYPSLATMLLLGMTATGAYLGLGITAIDLNGKVWLAMWSATIVCWYVLWTWLRRFNLASHEKHERGLSAFLLALFTGPVYMVAGAMALLRRPLTYAVTAKGKLSSVDSLRGFRLHFLWAAVAAGLLIVSIPLHHDYITLRFWALVSLVTATAPPVLATISRLTRRNTVAETIDQNRSATQVPPLTRSLSAQSQESATMAAFGLLADLAWAQQSMGGRNGSGMAFAQTNARQRHPSVGESSPRSHSGQR